MSDSNSNLKTCTVCNKSFPATSEYFHKHSSGRDNLRPDCKECVNKRNRDWRANNKQWMSDYNRQWREENKARKQELDKQYYQDNKERIKRRNLEYYYTNHEKRLAKKREYNRKHFKRLSRMRHIWYIANRESVAEYHCEYRKKNADEIRKKKREYQRNNPDGANRRNRRYAASRKGQLNHIMRQHRRRARKRSLPDTFTIQEWEYCLEYFNYTCPVCDNQLRDLFGNIEPHADHWIPLAHPDCSGTVKENMVCLCNSCNQSKGAKLPKDWLLENYSKKQTDTIMNRVHAYFQSLL